MGILNITPDSFYEGSRVNLKKDILQKTEQMILEGVDILDVGAYSTRPNAQEISVREELNRAIPAIEVIVEKYPETIISIDTFRSEVAEKAISAGASIINDVSGGELDSKMFEIVARLQVPYILMHSRGNPQTMTQLTQYENIINELLDYFIFKIQQLQSLGVKDIIIDLGFGFAKNIEQNFFLLHNQSKFKILGMPILTGISRKSMIYKTLKTTPNDALNGTSALNMIALQQSADILRVHDVKQAREVITLWRSVLEKSNLEQFTQSFHN
ncbi:MAG: dihydropteroate synthase [Flammeovirgaceae bacterium]